MIADEPVFALKGGTAINLFYRDLPRLSVDIDLTYLPLKPRSRAWLKSTRPSTGSLGRSKASRASGQSE
nr:nucleotidyl transferase AbiEii/AbiGii toxin family protein [Rhizobium leguminosarum]